ncbi:hypothetical protein GA0070624_2156 [Micromonospora rhizosphaerae]|uniref:Glycosyltransferase involved in cell wall biogenesis n=1 Tax=Micromonospora rhizosphaerae TaxID=568872 RepID=A0A1C6RUL4_9ACTN|nr:DUF2064 domain-containing protein [Micromonospora rhizosphaerae]SCL20903.1 hypothetical protein GA0070624_2156 [Micromonospora rhizosphaerae]
MTVLLVMAKAPVPGRVKTRLCPPASPAQAAEVAAAALLDTLDAVGAVPGVVPVLALAGRLADAVRGAEIRAALAGWCLLPQRGKDLGDRLAAAHGDVGAAFPGRPVLQIGMDTPQLDAELLGAAVRTLAEADAVLGPAVDGGWWALGMRDPGAASVLREVPMSTRETGRLTRAALLDRGLAADSLPTLSDVDDWAAALAVATAAPDGRFRQAVGRIAAGLAEGLARRTGVGPDRTVVAGPARERIGLGGGR